MSAESITRARLEPESRARRIALPVETGLALGATTLTAGLLILNALNAGPLWRDETNSANVAQMPSLAELWNTLPFESFPALWLLVLRAWSSVGLGSTDLGIRCLGLLIGLGFLSSLWLAAKWIGRRAPTLSLALLGTLPAFINTVGANRAYGLALCLAVLLFGALWRMVESPSRGRVGIACVISILFVQCLYYDAIFLAAMLFAAVLVVMRRRDWKTLVALIGIGLLAAASMVIYLPVIHRGSAYGPISQVPFDLWALWTKAGQAVAARSSAQIPVQPGIEVWLWLLLTIAGLAIALLAQLRRIGGPLSNSDRPADQGTQTTHADLALFSSASLVIGLGCYSWFLLKLGFPTHPWYYMVPFSLLAIALEGLLGTPYPELWPGGVARAGVLCLFIVWGASAAWEEAHMRRSNLDIIASVLESEAKPNDLVLVQSAYEGITFDRYYNGPAHWMTIPPIDSHKVHRNDLLWARLNQANPMEPVLNAIDSTVKAGGHIWFVGPVPLIRPGHMRPAPPPPPNLPTKWWLPPYMEFWAEQATAQIVAAGRSGETVPVSAKEPLNHLENLPLTRF